MLTAGTSEREEVEVITRLVKGRRSRRYHSALFFVNQTRMDGYVQAMREAKLEIESEWIVEGEFLHESGYRAMSFFMNLPERPTALVVIDDIIAFGASSQGNRAWLQSTD